jgi:hypothetical protein
MIGNLDTDVFLELVQVPIGRITQQVERNGMRTARVGGSLAIQS